MGLTVINETPDDPLALYRMRLEVTEQFAKVFFKPAEWNSIVRAGLYEGAMYWIDEYLPLRFTGYARSDLKYRGSKKGTPLVRSGRLQESALSESWAEARSTSSNATATLHIATGTMLNSKGASTGYSYAGNPVVYEVLTSITDREIRAIALKMESTILGLIEGSSVTVTRKSTVRGSLTPTQKSGIAHTAKRSAVTHTQRAS
jgi:hypothetical protein